MIARFLTFSVLATMLAPVDGGTLVLLSGGIDSSATLALYRRRPVLSVSALFVDYGQAAARHEQYSADKLAAHYDVALLTVGLSGLGRFEAGYIKGRNALLLQTALTASPFQVGQIAIGLHAGTPYADCGPAFLAEIQRVFDIYCDGKIRVVAPFINQDKRAVVEFSREVGVPMDMTYSCEIGADSHCGECLSCLDRRALGVS